jgi:tRNA-dihydrouridine synthase B
VRLGDLDLDVPVYLAPMAGVTNEAFRRLCHEQGATVVMSEMVSARALVMGNARTEAMLGVAPDEHPVAVQLFGSEPDIVAEAAVRAEAAGADMVDLNLGCPVEKIVKGGSGAALLREPELAAAVVERAARALRVPFTVKMRAGWDSVTAPEVARRLAGAGARAVAVHCRTRAQQYTGTADWTILERVREAVADDVCVIGNGDVKSAADALRVVHEHGADGVMVGRGALGNPWLFAEIAEALRTGHAASAPAPAFGPRLDTLLRHFELLRGLKGDALAVVEIRRHAAHYVRGMPQAAEERVRLMQCDAPEAFTAEVERYRALVEAHAAGATAVAAGDAAGARPTRPA